MAVFTLIGATIAGAIGLTGTFGAGLFAGLSIAGTIVASAVAAGLAYGTAKILGVGKVPKPEDPGAKIQLPPGTDNKVGKLYGRNYMGGIIIDAEIKNQNKTMTYALVLSEFTPGETWTVNKIYRGDNELVFGYAGATNHIVSSIIDSNATATNSVGIQKKWNNGKIRCRVYAGGSSSTNQIFPTTNKVNAYGSGTGQFSNWSASNGMANLVFAIFEIDYDPENNLVQLDAITFDIENNVSNPANVLLDYLSNERYGCNLANTFIDTDSFNAWFTYCNTSVNYYDSANVLQSHPRSEIDGIVSTYNNCKENIDKICRNSGAFFTYNNKSGKFGVVVNRAATVGEKANAYVFNDDNIISKITLTNTDLFNLYNQMEVEFPSVVQRDQTDTVFLETPSGSRNINEPDNKLNVRLDMVNDRARAINLANVDLRQSRFSTVLQFRADYQALQVDVGEVVKVSNEIYGFTNKLFRVMRTTEVEDADGMLSVDILLLEYDDTIYTETVENSSAIPNNSGIPNWWAWNANANISLGNITIASNVIYGSNANIYNPNTGNVIGNINIDDALFNGNINFGNTNPWVNFPIFVPGNTTFDTAIVEVINNNTSNIDINNGITTTIVRPPGGFPYFAPGSVFNFARDLNNFTNLNGGDDFRFQIHLEDSMTGTRSNVITTPPIPINVENIIDNKQIASYGAGAQLENFADASPNLANTAATYTNLLTPTTYDLTGIDQGEYILDASAFPAGSYYSGAQLGFKGNANVLFSNTTHQTSVTYGGGGVVLTTSTIMPTLVDSRAIFIDVPYLNSLNPSIALDMLPVSANVWAQGYSTLSNAVFSRSFGDPKVNLFKINDSQVEP